MTNGNTNRPQTWQGWLIIAGFTVAVIVIAVLVR
jgi:hypothetical protein